MRKNKNRRRVQHSLELPSNMSVVSTTTTDVAHEHIGPGSKTEASNLAHKEHKGRQSISNQVKSCKCDHHVQDSRPKDPIVLKANLKKGPIFHNGCNDVKKVVGAGHPKLVKSKNASLHSQNNVGNRTTDQKSYRNNRKSVHNNLEAAPTSVISEPISELAKLVENIDIQNEFVSREAGLPADQAADLSGSLVRGDDDEDDEILGEFGAVGPPSVPLLDNDHDEELPSSLSDFVLGYRNDSYPIPPVPPNDNDIDVINVEESEHNINLVPYESELQMPDIMRLITKDLSEPYSIYTYRYFIHNWPQLCFLAMYGSTCVGAIVCKLDVHKKMVRRGYIAMLAVDENHRKCKIGSSLVRKAIRAMVRGDCDEVVLETEITNKPALRLYENLGFVRDKRLFRYYLNGVDALRLKLWLR